MNDIRPEGPPPTPIREIVHVSANLRQDGGGAAHFGRVLGRALRRYASERGLRFRGLHLPGSDGGAALDGYDSFRGSRARLALATATLQAFGGRGRLLVFDHPGPARIQGRLPAWSRSRYAVALLGIDSWKPLSPNRARSLSAADLLLAISEHTLVRARPFLPEGCRPVVVHPGLEPRIDGGVPDRAAIESAGQTFALIVGRLAASERYKGHDELLEAWPGLREYLPEARLAVVGGGDDESRLREKAQALGVGTAARFLGRVDAATLTELYRRSSVFVLPSTDEGFGLVFLEAMAAARPCVALEGTAPAEIILHQDTGLLVPSGDRGEMTRALAALLGNRERGDRMGQAGRRRFDREFTFEAFERRFRPHLDALWGAT